MISLIRILPFVCLVLISCSGYEESRLTVDSSALLRSETITPDSANRELGREYWREIARINCELLEGYPESLTWYAAGERSDHHLSDDSCSSILRRKIIRSVTTDTTLRPIQSLERMIRQSDGCVSEALSVELYSEIAGPRGSTFLRKLTARWRDSLHQDIRRRFLSYVLLEKQFRDNAEQFDRILSRSIRAHGTKIEEVWKADINRVQRDG